MPDHNNKPSTIIAGAVLLAASLGAALFMSHHPTLGTPGHDSLASEAVAEAGVNGIIHGAMILFVLAYYFGLSTLSQRLGNMRAEVRAAQLAISVATITMIGAALISGFIVPGVADHFTGGGAADDQLFRAQLTLLGESNQALAKIGTIAYGAAIFFWSLRLIRMPGLSRIAGGLGCVIGALLALGILTGHLALDVRGMGAVVVALGVWFAIIALQMIRNKL